MSGEVILFKVQNFLSNLQKGKGPELKFSEMGRFADFTNAAIKRQLNPDKPREFRLRASNIGRPGCILQSEKFKHERDPEPYASRFRNAYGDIIEATAVLTLKQAGVNIVAEQQGVTLQVAGKTIEGTFDLIIDEGVKSLWDVKSSSGYTFRHHYQGKNLQNLWDEGDSFGYVCQLYFYAQALSIPVGGLIVINKENGEWTVVVPPQDDTQLKKLALSRIAANTIRLTTDQPFSKDFAPVEEWYRKKKTGNEVLPPTCAFCTYRKTCWPNSIELPQLASQGASPKKFYYTKIDPKYKDKQQENE